MLAIYYLHPLLHPIYTSFLHSSCFLLDTRLVFFPLLILSQHYILLSTPHFPLDLQVHHPSPAKADALHSPPSSYREHFPKSSYSLFLLLMLIAVTPTGFSSADRGGRSNVVKSCVASQPLH